MKDRVHRDLAPEDIAKIKDTYHNWRKGENYQNEKGFCKSATLQEIQKLCLFAVLGWWLTLPFYLQTVYRHLLHRVCLHIAHRVHRDLAPEDIAKIKDTYRNWRKGENYQNEKGFCKSATLQEIQKPTKFLRISPSPEVLELSEPLDKTVAITPFSDR
jgi:hypothetical protein